MTLEVACMVIVAWMFMLGTWTSPLPRDYKILIYIVEIIIPKILSSLIILHLLINYILKNYR